MTKDDCIEKICNLLLDFKVAAESSLALLQESKFEDFYKDITKQDIINYLSRNRILIETWKIWSENKRTWGYYLSFSSDTYLVGSLDKYGKVNFSKSFVTAEDACAEFILREVSAILEIKSY